jgi:DNA-3-methyladenine glycosylase I
VGDTLGAYHDTEWGVPLHDDGLLFEQLVLQGFQAGLSWITVLRKREAFQSAFDGFDVPKVAAYDEAKVDQLLDDAGIIRNRAKIRVHLGFRGRHADPGWPKVLRRHAGRDRALPSHQR